MAREVLDRLGMSGNEIMVVALAGVPLAIFAVLFARRSRRRATPVERRFGKYELVERLGDGAMGEVWEARHETLIRPAAVKLIRREVLDLEGSGARARFEREAQATSALRSPHTVELYDFGVTESGTYYYAMELLEGIDLESFVQRFGPMEPERALHLLEQVARSLDEAHELGLVHRDIKPANIFVCRLGNELDYVKVLDLGLVKPRWIAEGSAVSVEGTIRGTPAFIAPETAAGRSVDGRADLYSLGCVAYWLLTGTWVFDVRSAAGLLLAHIYDEPERPSDRLGREIPELVERLLLDLLQKDPEKRIGSARELIGRVRECRRAIRNDWDEERAHGWWRTHLGQASLPRPALAL